MIQQFKKTFFLLLLMIGIFYTAQEKACATFNECKAPATNIADKNGDTYNDYDPMIPLIPIGRYILLQ